MCKRNFADLLFSYYCKIIFFIGLQVDSPEDLAREAAFKIYYWHDESQEELLQDLLTSRHQLAQLCGYPTFAHRAMVESLAETPEKVDLFLNKLSRELRLRVSQNYNTMLALKKKANPACSSLEMWDVPYFTTQAKNNFFQIDSTHISEYFSLGVCMEGLNTLYQNIFNVYLELETPAQGEIWHPDVYKLAVRDCDSQEVLGHIYCDFFVRSGKPYQDCHFTIQGGRLRRDNSYQNPVVVLMLNLPVPGWSRPTLLTSGMIDNLFHEMGHAMHSMLARTKYQVNIVNLRL
jgi:intermediate peptidase